MKDRAWCEAMKALANSAEHQAHVLAKLIDDAGAGASAAKLRTLQRSMHCYELEARLLRIRAAGDELF